jgi:leader peptidase (prepilin peptidase)/N-methyltransferase
MAVAHAVVLGFFAAVLIVLAVIDARTRLLPNRIVLPAAGIVLAAQIALSPDRWLEWVLAALGASLFLLAAALAYPGGLGMGDVKLALLLGAALGWSVAAALTIGLVAASVASIVLIAREGWAARKKAIPLGPFLALGGLAAIALSAAS